MRGSEHGLRQRTGDLAAAGAYSYLNQGEVKIFRKTHLHWLYMERKNTFIFK